MEIKNYTFACPECDSVLSHKGKLVLTTRRANGDTGTIYLEMAIGNYDYTHEPPAVFEKGELVEFFCPFCQANLKSEDHENFARLKMIVDEGIEFELLFSRIAGERKTHIITEDGIETYSGK